MTDAEDQLRSYAAAVERAQRPVELADVVARRRRSPRRSMVGAAAVLVCAVVIAGALVIERGHGGRTRVEVSPSRSSLSTAPTLLDCPAASLTVTSTSGERLHAAWLPSGFVLTQGNESDLGQHGGLEYATPRYGDRPYVELGRDHSTEPLTHLVMGTHRPVVVHGHEGIVSVGVPFPQWTSVAWKELPGTALVVTGYDLSQPELLKIAEGVQYQPGSPFTYPTHPAITVTRAQALATLGGSDNDGHAALTSFGEIDALTRRAEYANHLPTLAAGVSVTQPVWVAWRPAAANPVYELDVDNDAQSDNTVATIPRVNSRALDSITDRSAPTCAPPFGVLTRSEVASLRPPLEGATAIVKLTTEGALRATRSFSGLLDCALYSCDPTVPVWLVVQTAPDQRFASMGLAARPTNTKPGSWSVTAVDARTGPQTTNLNGASLGPGPAPADLLAVLDLSPG